MLSLSKVEGLWPVLPFLRERLERRRATLASALSLVGMTTVLILSVLVLASTTNQPFIYFRF